MTPNTSPASRFPGARTALAAALLASAALSAQASVALPQASYTFSGVVDSGPLLGDPHPDSSEHFSGSFTFPDPGPGYDGPMNLDSFSLHFDGPNPILATQHYDLAGADAATLPVAWFSGGSFVGVDYQYTGSADASVRPWVYMTAGFSDLSEAYFSYDSSGGGVQGFGSLNISAVPEPGSWALMLAGLLATGALVRRR